MSEILTGALLLLVVAVLIVCLYAHGVSRVMETPFLQTLLDLILPNRGAD